MAPDIQSNNSSYSPFSKYDVFAYLIPGSAFIFIGFIFDVWFRNNAIYDSEIHTPIFTAISSLLSNTILESVTLSLLYIVIAALITYVTGHLVAGISAFSIDRLLMGRGYYYPFVTLTTKKEELSTKGPKNRVRSGFTLFNLLLLLSTVLFFIIGTVNIQIQVKKYLAIIVGVVLILGLISTFFYMTGINKKEMEGEEVVSFMLFFAKIYNYISNRIGHFTGTNKTLSENVIEKFKKFTESNFGTRELIDSDIYWLSYIYISHKSKVATDHLVNWLYLYSYARNLATALYLSSLYVLVIISINKFNGTQIDIISYLLFPTLFISSFIMLTRYFYLYVSYYSKYLIRACVVVEEDKLEA